MNSLDHDSIWVMRGVDKFFHSRGHFWTCLFPSELTTNIHRIDRSHLFCRAKRSIPFARFKSDLDGSPITFGNAFPERPQLRKHLSRGVAGLSSPPSDSSDTTTRLTASIAPCRPIRTFARSLPRQLEATWHSHRCQVTRRYVPLLTQLKPSRKRRRRPTENLATRTSPAAGTMTSRTKSAHSTQWA